MKIVVSLLNFLPGRIGGTETYLRQLIPRLSEAAGQHELMLLVDRQRDAENIFPGIARSVVDMGTARILVERGMEAVTPYRCRAVEQVLDRMQPDVVFFPQQSIFPKNVEAPCVLVVHDLYHIYLPQNLSPIQRLVRNRGYASSLYGAEHIIAISQFTKDTVVEHYGVNPDRVSVIRHGVGPVWYDPMPGDLELTRPYLYYPAASLPHKNHAVLFESVARLKAEGRFDYELVLSGIQTKYWKALQRQIRRLDLEQTVRHLGFVSYDRVQQLFRGAECILFPTTFEGFGLPVVEAFEARKKIIVSPLKIFRELGVPERFQIDFGDPDQLDAAIRLPGMATLQHQPWTWQEAARATLDLLVEEAAQAGHHILPLRRPQQVAEPAQRHWRKAA
ncbi:MAG: glycosyltransferase family 4 protein [Thermoguttaceae bacterium]